MSQSTSSRPVYRIGGTVIRKNSGSPNMTPRVRTPRQGDTRNMDTYNSDPELGQAAPGPSSALSGENGQNVLQGRTIRFPDEPLTKPQAEAKHLATD
jgi:hypothetical protein